MNHPNGAASRHGHRQPPALAERRRPTSPAATAGTDGDRVRAKRRAQAEYLAEPGAGAPGRGPRRAHRPGRRLQRLRVQRRPRRLRSARSRARRRPATEVVLAQPRPGRTRTSSTSSTPMPPAERYSYSSTATRRRSTTCWSTRARSPACRGSPSRAATPTPRRRRATSPTSSSRISDHDAVVTYLRATPPDVTAQVRITRLPFVFNPFTRVSLSVVGVTNRGPAMIAGSIPPGIRRPRAGAPPARRERRHRRRSVPDAERPKLKPGETWLPLVRFANPGRVPVTFTPRVLSGAFYVAVGLEAAADALGARCYS